MTNGNKAKMIRERRGKEGPKGKDASHLKADAAAMTIICQTCRQAFMCTSREKDLTDHATNKHSKTIKECFPSFQVAA